MFWADFCRCEVVPFAPTIKLRHSVKDEAGPGEFLRSTLNNAVFQCGAPGLAPSLLYTNTARFKVEFQPQPNLSRPLLLYY